jgi:hypothetical protein
VTAALDPVAHPSPAVAKREHVTANATVAELFSLSVFLCALGGALAIAFEFSKVSHLAISLGFAGFNVPFSAGFLLVNLNHHASNLAPQSEAT